MKIDETKYIFSDWTPRRSKENTALLYQKVQRSSSTLGYLNLFKYNWNRPRETNGNKNSERLMRRNVFSRDWASRKSKENRVVLNLISCLFSTYSLTERNNCTIWIKIDTTKLRTRRSMKPRCLHEIESQAKQRENTTLLNLISCLFST